MYKNQRDKNSEGGLSVLIAGGTGLIGKYLTSVLLAEGYKVSHLSRQTNSFGKVRVFRWEPAHEYLNPEAFEGIDCLVHLSGANIGEKRWSLSRKKEIRSSRVDSTNLLFRTVWEKNINLKAFVTASAVGFYGSLTSERIFTEQDPPSDDFLGTTCRLWEETADLFEGIGIRTVKIRTAVVLAKNDSALDKLMKPARFGLVVRLGNGKQYFPWIHINDLCDIYLKAIKDQNMSGPYNAVAPEHVNHDVFVRTMASVMEKPVFLPHVPAWILRAVLGKKSEIVLTGSRISSEKIINAGYSFRYENLSGALKSVIRD